LINPNYRIDPSQAPTEMKIELEISELKLTGIKSLDIDVFQFKTTDSTVARIIDYLKELIKAGDDYFKKKDYSSALLEYKKVIEKIRTKLPESKQKKLTEFESSVDDRIVSSYAMYFKGNIKKADKTARSGDYLKALKNYENIKEEFNQIETKHKKELNYLNNTLNRRIDSIYVMKAKQNEKKGDIYYSEYKFEKAIKYYGYATWNMGRKYDKKSSEHKKYIKKLIEKKKAANKAGYSYFNNTVQSYCDWIDYYNISEQESQAKQTLAKLRVYIKGSNWCDDKEILKAFNERAGLMKENKMQPCFKQETRIIGGIEFVRIPAGFFMMGSHDGDSDERPVHKVTVSSFWLSKYEITQKQYEKIMVENPSRFKGPDNPVDRVSWYDAIKFCKKFKEKYGVEIRLPYEAEWEYACRAGTSTKYYWGNKMDEDFCWYSGNSGGETHPVGKKKPNGFGLYDMIGNVWEWCMDWYGSDYYSSSPVKNPHGPAGGEYKVLRGGSWFNTGYFVRTAFRSRYFPVNRSYLDGFRVVSSLE